MRHFFRYLCAYCVIGILTAGNAVVADEAGEVKAEKWSVRMAESVMKRNPEPWMIDFRKKPKWEYTQGLVLKSLLHVWQETGDRRYFDYVKAYYDQFISDDGNIWLYKLEDYNIDRINPGKPLFSLYRETGEEKFKKAVFLLRSQMKTHPRTNEGGFWHKKRYPCQMWLDGLYMAAPFLGEFAVTFDEPDLFDDIANQFKWMESHARDQKTGLLYHGWDESRQQRWANPETGLSPHFWGRAMGWFSMALVDVLDFFPQDHPRRGEIVAILQRLASALKDHQEAETGVWYQIINLPERKGNYRESSATSMYVYAILKGVRKGYLSMEYLAVAEKGYKGILEQFVEVDKDGLVNITSGCSVAGLGGDPYRDGSFEYYISEPVRNNDTKAVGPFILASLEMEALKNIGENNKRQSSTECGWDMVPGILARIKAPVFPKRDFLITDFGAVGDAKTESTEAFKEAIEVCSKTGGGRVVVPSGTYLTGAIHLKSNVNLHISKNATVLFSKDTKNYLPVVYTRFEGVECMNYSPFIYAYEQENIAITGSGTLDGNASSEDWWEWKGKKEYGWVEGEANGDKDVARLFSMPDKGIPVEERVFGAGSYIRPNFMQPYKCKNVLIDSVTIRRSPMWVIHPVLSENVTVQNVSVISHGPNNDGCNPESSRDVLIKNCYFDTGDDCIAIKSGRNTDGRRVGVASENIVVQGCTMKDGHGGVVIGSEMSGSVRNVFAEDCQMDSPNLERVLRIKTNSMRGGTVENIYMRNVTVGEVSDAVLRVNFNYGEGDAGQHTPVVRNIFMQNVTSRKSKYAILLSGYKRSPISNLVLQNCRFSGVEDGNMLDHFSNLQLNEVYINGELHPGVSH